METKLKEAKQVNALSVSELTQIIRALIENEPLLQDIWVQGEVSNVSLKGGHLYFTLKDAYCAIQCVFFNFSKEHKFTPEDGLSVLVFGEVGVYERKGQYQLIVRDIVVKGEGILAQRFEELKRRLYQEGLFAEEHKKKIPFLPKVIGVVTSVQAAAWQDVLKVLTRRAPYLRVILFDTQVQGDTAPASIISALKNAERVSELDVILLVRGGGSLEDLWCFNDEKLVRTIYHLRKPVITGIGHEIDFTLVDFVADKRAPTPSAAAEIVAPSISELSDSLHTIARSLIGTVRQRIKEAKLKFTSFGVERLLKDVQELVANYSSELELLGDRMVLNSTSKLESKLKDLTIILSFLRVKRLVFKLKTNALALEDTEGRLISRVIASIKNRWEAIEQIEEKLSLLNPRAVLKRGYALVWDEKMFRIIREPEDVKVGDKLVTELDRGYIDVLAQKTRRK